MAKATYTRLGTTATHSQLFAFVMDRVAPYIEDLVTKDKPGLAFFSAYKDSELLEGGEQVRFRMRTGYNPNGGWVDENEPISTDDYDPYEISYYYPKHLAYGLTWTKQQMRAVRNGVNVGSLIEDKMDNTIDSVQRDLETGIHGTSIQKEMNGLKDLIPASTPATQNSSGVKVGELSPQGNSWWQSQGTDMSSVSSVSELENQMMNMWNTIHVEGGKVDIIFSDQTVAETYEKNMREFLQGGLIKIGDWNYDLIQYKGVPIVFSSESSSGEMRFVDKRHCKMAVDPMFYYGWTDWKEVPNVPFSKHAQLVLDLQMCRGNPRRLGCLFSIAE